MYSDYCMRTLLTAASLLTGDGLVPHPILVIEDGSIAAVSTRDAQPLPQAHAHHDFPDSLLAPAYLDVHTHGCCGRDVMEATPEALGTVGEFLARHGVGAYLPTTITAPKDRVLHSLAGLAHRIAAPALPGHATPLGIHLEGPFLSHRKRGAHPERDLLEPSIPFFDRMVEAAEGHVLLMTIAPELPGAPELIAHAVARGVRVSIGHSDANSAAARAGIAAGAVSATHTFNAMRSLDHREPGILGAVLSDDALYAEIICDGLHVTPDVVRLFSRAKPRERVLLVTDSMSATGMPDGAYKLGELDVQVTAGRAITGHDTLAGSTLTMDRAVENYARFTGAPLAHALQAATANPAAMLGRHGIPAGVRTGQPADINVVWPDGKLQATFLAGVRVPTARC